MPWEPQLADLAHVLEHRTCELATAGRSAPAVRPTSAAVDAEHGLVTVTAPTLSPSGALAGRRDGRVALLFPAPAADDARAADAPDVLVLGELVDPPGRFGRGRTDEPDRTDRSDLPGHPDEVDRPGRPGRPGVVGRIGADAVSRRLVDWYDRHVVLTVAPTQVRLRSAPPPTAGSVPRSLDRRTGAFAVAARRLAAFPSVLLAAGDAEGAPWLLRVRPVPDAATGTFVVDVPAGEPVRPGPACLVAHGEDDRLWRLRGVVVTGDLVRTGGRWVLTPHGRAPSADAGLPAVVLREGRRVARRALAPRPLRGPVIPGVTPMLLEAPAPRPDAASIGRRS